MKNLARLLPIALFCIAGCSSEDFETQELADGGNRVLKATIEQRATTRVNVKEDNALVWTTGDMFTVFDDANGKYEFTLQGEGNTTEGTFAPVEEISDDVNLKYAVYPASDDLAISDNILTLTLPASYAYTEGEGIGVPMFTTIEKGGISFRHLAGLLKVEVSEAPADVTSVTLKASEPISGSFTADISAAAPVLASTSTDDADKQVTVIFDKATTSVLYIPLPQASYESIEVVFGTAEDAEKYVVKSWENKRVIRAYVYKTSLSYTVLDGDLTPAEVGEALQELLDNAEEGDLKNYTIDVAGTVTNDAESQVIVVPQKDNANIEINLGNAPEATTEEAPLVVMASTEVRTETPVEEARNTLSVSIPEDATDVFMEVNTPKTTVSIDKGSFKKLTARTATTTLILGEGTKIETLVVNGGSVLINKGAEVSTIIRDANNEEDFTVVSFGEDASTSVIFKNGVDGAELTLVDITDESEFYIGDCEVSVAEKKALQDFYAALNGDNWEDNTNWNSEKPVRTWTGVTVSNGVVSGIGLYNNGLEGVLPASIGELTGMQNLNLQSNQLTGTLPAEITKLTGLWNINLYGSSLTGSLPEDIGNLTALRYLFLGGNHFEGQLPESITKINGLYNMDLSFNRLDGMVSPGVSAWLRTLNMFFLNQDNEHGIVDLNGELITTKNNLTDLEQYYKEREALIAFYQATGGDSWNSKENWLSDLPIGKWQGVHTEQGLVVRLELPNNNLRGELPEYLNVLTSLSYLNLSNNWLTGNIPEALVELENLQYLYLNNNMMTTNLSDAMSTWLEGLQEYNIEQKSEKSVDGNEEFNGQNHDWN